jgi:hypothetical protein
MSEKDLCFKNEFTPFLAPAKNILEHVKIIPFNEPTQAQQTKIGTKKAKGPIARCANVTATASEFKTSDAERAQ